MVEQLRQLLLTFGIVLLVAAALGLGALLLLHRRLRRLNVPPNADFVSTLRAVPLALVIAIDLLDFGLDIFATPIVWVVLSRYRLQALRNIAAVEAIIPFTQVVPTLTVAWLGVRILGLGDRPRTGVILDADELEPGRYETRTGGRQ
jgi:hypothetical protein